MNHGETHLPLHTGVEINGLHACEQRWTKGVILVARVLTQTRKFLLTDYISHGKYPTKQSSIRNMRGHQRFISLTFDMHLGNQGYIVNKWYLAGA